MKIKSLLLAIAMVAICGVAKAHDFACTINNQPVYFNVLSNKSVEVTYKGKVTDKTPTNYNGELVIPETVNYNGATYRVVAIGPKAFRNAQKLTAIRLPESINSIGDFAFENCTALQSIVFPANEVKFGQGAFFNCTSIKNVTFGSNWQVLNLEMFRWSSSLSELHIPANVVQVKNAKRLKGLRSFTVDKNNKRLASYDGVLYSKDFKTLYICPRAFFGRLYVHGGTEVITNGALVNSVYVTEVVLPQSLTELSFREFSRMKNLEAIYFNSYYPIITATSSYGSRVFLLQVANPNVIIYTPNDAKVLKRYREAICLKAGEYRDNDGVPYSVYRNELPAKDKMVKRNK